MASRLYPSTRALFFQVVGAMRQLGLSRAVTPTAFALMALYLCGLLLLDKRQTPWRMQQWLPARCHDAANRLLREMTLSTRQLLQALVRWAKTQGQGYLCLDEVVIEKAYSRQVAWTGWIYSFAKKRQVYGLHIVVLTYCVGEVRIPVNFRLWRPQDACAPHTYKTKLQLAEVMLVEVQTWGLEVDYVVFDTHYTAGWFTKKLSNWQLSWVGTLDPKTKVIYHGQSSSVRALAERSKLKYRSHLGLRAKAISVYAPKFGPLKLVVTRNRHGNFEYLVSNDKDADLTEIIRRKRSRGSIETVFRDTKQFAALEACQCRVDSAWVRHVAFALIGFTLLQRLRRSPEETLGAVKERLQLQALKGNLQPPVPLKAQAALT